MPFRRGNRELNEFFRCLLESNPFESSAVRGPADAAVHVPAVHQRQLEEVVACAEQVRKNSGYQGLAIWGEAGVGKTHLLTQFCRWAGQESRVYCRVFRSLPMDSTIVPWHIVRSMLRQMTHNHRGVAESTALGRLVRRAVEQATAALPAQSNGHGAEQTRITARHRRASSA